MTSKAPGGQDRQSRRDGSPKEHMEVHYLKNMEQADRWRVEHEQRQAEEEKIAKLSRFDYEPVDYSHLLERKPWVERPLTDYSYLLEEARVKVERDFFYPVLAHVGILFILFILLVFNVNTIVLAFSGGISIVILISLYMLYKKRISNLAKALENAQEEMVRRTEYEKRMLSEAKRLHDEAEERRIANAQRLISGEQAAIILRLDEIMPRIGMPFVVEVNFDVYEDTILAQVWLPAKGIIPKQTTSLVPPAGRISYEDKEPRQINRQYLELCAGVVMKILVKLYENIPTLYRVYINCVSREDIQDECLFTIATERETFEEICRLGGSAFTAAQSLQAQFDCDPHLAMHPVHCVEVEEWAEVEKKKIGSIKLKLYH